MAEGKTAYLQSLEEVVFDPVLITGSSSKQAAEIANNMWTISASAALALELTVADFEIVLGRVIENREQQLRELATDAIFYLWFDEQIPAVRFNLVSGVNTSLPFGVRVRTIDSMAPLIEEFLASAIHDGIPIPDEVHSSDEDDAWAEQEDFALPVCAVRLPREGPVEQIGGMDDDRRGGRRLR